MTILKIAAIILITVAAVLALVTDPPLASLTAGGGSSRIFFFHVPVAMVSFLSFMIAAGYAVAYLRTRRPVHDEAQAVAAELGLTFSIVAMITGAIWAKQAWGAYWNWDPRQLFLFVLILFYGAFFALRQATTIAESRRRLSAVYLVFGGAISPFLFFVLPRMYRSLHEDANQVVIATQGKINMSATVGTIFALSSVGFVLLFIWLFQLGRTAARIQSVSEGDDQ
ncbi:MAG TPA: cytochrome c biogenesis protein CcsA [Acidobacteriota bacterium]|nr:cytochrome c biogenesis protein CcsA [Acidobacteriota bacterium]